MKVLSGTEPPVTCCPSRRARPFRGRRPEDPLVPGPYPAGERDRLSAVDAGRQTSRHNHRIRPVASHKRLTPGIHSPEPDGTPFPRRPRHSHTPVDDIDRGVFLCARRSMADLQRVLSLCAGPGIVSRVTPPNPLPSLWILAVSASGSEPVMPRSPNGADRLDVAQPLYDAAW